MRAARRNRDLLRINSARRWQIGGACFKRRRRIWRHFRKAVWLIHSRPYPTFHPYRLCRSNLQIKVARNAPGRRKRREARRIGHMGRSLRRKTQLLAAALCGVIATLLALGLSRTATADATIAPASRDAVSSAILPADRATVWTPGLMAAGGIPVRSKSCARLTPHGGGGDDTAQIQAAIKTCPAGQVVQLAEGEFLINGGNFVLIDRGITLRGSGPGKTTLAKTDGAKPFHEAVGEKPSPLIVVGPFRWPAERGRHPLPFRRFDSGRRQGRELRDAHERGRLSQGQIVLLDETSGAAWQTDPQGRDRFWASPDWRVTWRKHNPAIPYLEDFAADAYPATPAPRRLLVLQAGPPHRRNQTDRVGLRVHRRLHVADPHFLPVGPRRPTVTLRLYSRRIRRRRGYDVDRRRQWQPALFRRGHVLGQECGKRRLARRGSRHRQRLSYRA